MIVIKTYQEENASAKPQRIDVRGEQLINYVMERQIL